MIAATSATVRNLTSLSGVASAAIGSPLPTELTRFAESGASVTPVSSVSPVWKRATPCESCHLVKTAFERRDCSITAGTGAIGGQSAEMQLRPIERHSGLPIQQPVARCRPCSPCPDRLAGTKLTAAVPGGLDRCQYGRPDAMPLQLADG